MACVNKSLSYRIKTHWLPTFCVVVLCIAFFAGVVSLLWDAELISEAITAILITFFWGIILRRVVKEVDNENLTEILDVPAMELDDTQKSVQDKLDAIQHCIEKIDNDRSCYNWTRRIPKDCKEFLYDWHPSAEALIKSVLYRGRSLAILNKKGEVEIKV